MKSTFGISEAATRAGVSPDTLRYYERKGVLPPPARTRAGYRQYSAAAVERVQFVRNALRFGFSLKEIAFFLHACDRGHAPCREVRAVGERLLGEMDRQIDDLTAARAAVRKTLLDWDGRLARTPSGARARLLGTLTPTSPSASPVKQRRIRRG